MLGISCFAYAQSTNQPFTLTVSALKSQVKVGDPVFIEVTMLNTSDHEIDCARNSSNGLDRNYQYEVNDEHGPVPKIEKKYHGGFNPSPCALEPGESATGDGGLISRLYDFSQPGTYTIHVSRPIWGDDQRPNTTSKEDTEPSVVKSNTITITVLPADDPPASKK